MRRRLFATLALFGCAILPQIVCAQSYATGRNGTTFAGTVNQATTTNLTGVYPSATPSLAPGQQQQLTVDQQGSLNVHVQGGGSGGSSGAVYPATGSSPFPVTGPFFQSTQPVSIATTVPVSIVGGGSGGGPVYPAVGASPFPISGSVNVGNFPATQPVSGTFYQATQPVSIATTIPVSVNNFPGSQTVSGSVAVSNLPTTQNVNIIASTPLPIQPVTLNVPSPLPVTLSTPAAIFPGYTSTLYYAGASSSGQIVKSAPGALLALINTSTSAQSATMTCYNNASAASGNVLWAGTLQASQVITLGMFGIYASAGIFCQPSAATNSGNGMNFLYE